MAVQQYSVVENDWINLTSIINDLTQRVVGQELHPTSTPTFADLTLTGDLDITGDVDITGDLDVGGTVTFDDLTASRIVATGASKELVSLASPLIVPEGGTGAATLTGYVKGNGTSAMTASATIPYADLAGRAYISAYDTADQTGNVAAATAVKFGTTAFNAGITVENDGSGNVSRITYAAAGTYMLAPSIQLSNSDSSDHDVTFWFRKNGSNIANSATVVTVPKAGDGGDCGQGHGLEQHGQGVGEGLRPVDVVPARLFLGVAHDVYGVVDAHAQQDGGHEHGVHVEAAVDHAGEAEGEHYGNGHLDDDGREGADAAEEGQQHDDDQAQGNDGGDDAVGGQGLHLLQLLVGALHAHVQSVSVALLDGGQAALRARAVAPGDVEEVDDLLPVVPVPGQLLVVVDRALEDQDDRVPVYGVALRPRFDLVPGQGLHAAETALCGPPAG